MKEGLEEKIIYFCQKLVWLPIVLTAKAFLHFEVEGQENFQFLNGQRHYFIIVNHRGFLDAFLFSAAIPWKEFRRIDIRYMMKEKALKNFPFCYWLGAYPLRRFPGDLEKTLQSTCELIKKKKNILIFPEGTFRGQPYKENIILRPKRGLGYLVKKFPSLPIVPLAIQGTDLTNGEKGVDWKKVFSRRVKVKIKIGQPFWVEKEVPQYQQLEDAELSWQLTEKIAQLINAKIILDKR